MLGEAAHLAARHDLPIELDLRLAVDDAHVEHGLAMVRQDELVKPLMPSVRTIEGFAREGDVTSAEQRRQFVLLEPKVRSGAVDLIRGPNRAQRGRRRGTGGLPRVGRTLNIGSPCTAAPGWHPVGQVIEGAEAVSSVGVRFGGKPHTPSPRRTPSMAVARPVSRPGWPY